MRKTLLIAAAALAAGVISSQAQVYSQNVVGYINQTIPANSFQIIGSQLINGSDVNATNGDINTTLTNGLVSSPFNAGTSTNSQMLYWSAGHYITYYYYNSTDASTWLGDAPGTDPSGWYLPNGSMASINLNNGHAAFIHNPSASPLTITTIGTVFQGTNIVVSTINPGYNLINLVVPVSTNLSVDASGNALPYGLPSNLTSSPNNPTSISNDSILVWSGGHYITYYYYNSADASTWLGDAPGTDPAGFYLPNGSLMPTSSYPSVNQGFFLNHNGTAINWTNSFSVQ